MCIMGPSRTLSKIVLIDLDLQGHLGSKLSKSAKNGLVRTITLVGLKLGSLNLAITCIMGRSRTGSYMVGFDLEGHLGSKLSKSAKNGLVRTITFEGLKLGSPNLAIRCITSRSHMGLYMAAFDLDLQGHLGSKLFKAAQKRAFSQDNF